MSIAVEDILLTAPQQEACEMMSKNLKMSEIAVTLEISRAAVINRFKGALKKIGIDEITRRYPSPQIQPHITLLLNRFPDLLVKHTPEVRKAKKDIARREDLIGQAKDLQEQTIALGGEHQIADDLDAQEAMQKIMIMAKKSGMPPAVVDALANRVLRGIANPPMMPENFKDEDLKIELHSKIRLVLSHIDNATIGGAKLAELSTALKTLNEQVLLLDGRPTAILGVADMSDLAGITDRLQAEMVRRQIKNVEGTCEDAETN
tara:strand:+ start:585 stop:1370 length:786 start_codon:yes stop_codon:yes gene_type:complete